MASYSKGYVFPLALKDTWKEELSHKTREKLTEMLGVEVDNVMAEYVIVMVNNKKNMEQIAHDLVDFIGDESAEQFAAWLSQLLPTFESQVLQSSDDAMEMKISQSPAEDAPLQKKPTTEENTPPKRIINLKGISSSEPPKKKTVSLSNNKGTIRSLNSLKTDADDVIARRAQRFGIVEKTSVSKSTSFSNSERNDRYQREEGRATSNKRRGSERADNKDGGRRLSQRLGPPVNVHQAKLDARDTLGSHKKQRKDRDRSEEKQHSDGHHNRRNDQDHDMNSARRKEKSRNDDAAPPLPPPGDMNGKQGYGPMGPAMGFQGGPMGFGGYPAPFGGPMFYPPPGFNPYVMGFPPQGIPPFSGRGYPQPMQNGPRGARPFQNRKWVNPNVAKAEEAKDKGDQPESDEPGELAQFNANTNTGAPAYTPRNPYFSSQMRPRFQNKTWVRQDSTKDEELNSSLPKTPPQELLESTD
ncbi:PWI domain [Plasmopara halstedii]|uniref:PWI domain n=1 Tax=Plasmopara halstedii TaxID=4781 RepID=A0A0P1AAQ8_PLAHL|nr:PWI domain [Plasmopara halstedii]CEG37886.1 PWI domain [Plasmopara halstedii]|eukprot:XP_024574255.1 PWI domain [Plasmopara halstedii]